VPYNFLEEFPETTILINEGDLINNNSNNNSNINNGNGINYSIREISICNIKTDKKSYMI